MRTGHRGLAKLTRINNLSRPVPRKVEMVLSIGLGFAGCHAAAMHAPNLPRALL